MPFSGKGVVMVDLNGRIVFASTYFCDLVGIAHDKIAGMSCFDFVYPEDMNEAQNQFELNKEPNAEPFRFRLRRLDGDPVWVDTQGAVLRAAYGDVYAISATVTAADQPMPSTKEVG
jgi:PAS domain S-box-containing protein